MAATKQKKKRPTPARPVQHPKRREEKRVGLLTAVLPLVAIAAFVVGAAFLLSDDDAATPAGGLPDTPDYHSLLVAPADPAHLVLGTHGGLYESLDGGQTWSPGGLRDNDAMNLVRTPAKTTWAAGHGVLAKSTDGGETWTEVSPAGLPHLDVHGFAAHPTHANRLYAAIAGQGLYRSVDGGESFEEISRRVGPDVYGLAVTPDGKLLAGDAGEGLLTSRDGGRSWRRTLGQPVLGIAVNPTDSDLVLAATPLGLYRSKNQGDSWSLVFPVAEGTGPLAWSPSEPRVAYAVGFDKRLYRSADRGETWRVVAAEG